VIDNLDSGHVGISETFQKLEDATAQALGELGSSDARITCSNESEGAAQQYSHSETITGQYDAGVADPSPALRPAKPSGT
jgi:hypothetical protein